MSKRTLVTVLVGLNLFLLALLMLSAYSLPAARAQAAGGGANYLLLTGEAQKDTDVLYLFDLRNRNLLVIEGRRVGQGARLVLRDARNLAADLRR